MLKKHHHMYGFERSDEYIIFLSCDLVFGALSVKSQLASLWSAGSTVVH